MGSNLVAYSLALVVYVLVFLDSNFSMLTGYQFLDSEGRSNSYSLENYGSP